ncbi:hypothetical protein LTR62_007796 [Meristemomyces frigidus]|uniref:RRM domain-containing protein n=1 Tax=Meristemomyces frigidus TaxID=1508187 RepID=A0AAN7YHK9_9PEZI|nr:hypothetical protein LTR62_007796 [Meristemomyces frigidus]
MHDYGPVIASSNRYADIEPYCGRIYNTEYLRWRDVLPWEFPQNALRTEEDAFLRQFFTDREIYLQGGEKGGYRFLKQVWYCIAIWNLQIKIPRLADAWTQTHQDIMKDLNLRRNILAPDVQVSTFFDQDEVRRYGEKLLMHTIKLIQYRVTQQDSARHFSPTETALPQKAAIASSARQTSNSSTASMEPLNATKSLEVQKVGFLPADKAVASLPTVPEHESRPRAESVTNSSISPVQVRKRGNSYSRPQQNITRNFSNAPRTFQRAEDLPQQQTRLSSAGPTIGNVPHLLMQNQAVLTPGGLVPYVEPPFATSHTMQGPLSSTDGNIHSAAQWTGTLPQLFAGPLPFLSSPPGSGGFRQFHDEDYHKGRHDASDFPNAGSIPDRRFSSHKYEDDRRGSNASRGGKGRHNSNGRGRGSGTRNSFSGGVRNTDTFVPSFHQGSQDVRNTARLEHTNSRRRDGVLDNNWRATTYGNHQQLRENVPPSRVFSAPDAMSPAVPRIFMSGEHAKDMALGLRSTHQSLPPNQAMAQGANGGMLMQHGRGPTHHGHDRPSNRHIPPGHSYITKLVVLGVPVDIHYIAVLEFFGRLGPVTSVSDMPIIDKKPTRDYWILFPNHESTVQALNLNGIEWFTRHFLNIQVPKEYWDPRHPSFPGYGHPDHSAKPKHHGRTPSNQFDRPHPASLIRPAFTSETTSEQRYVDDSMTKAKTSKEPLLREKPLSGPTTPSASGPNTPWKKAKGQKKEQKEREQAMQRATDKIIETRPASETQKSAGAAGLGEDVKLDEASAPPVTSSDILETQRIGVNSVNGCGALTPNKVGQASPERQISETRDTGKLFRGAATTETEEEAAIAISRSTELATVVKKAPAEAVSPTTVTCKRMTKSCMPALETSTELAQKPKEDNIKSFHTTTDLHVSDTQQVVTKQPSQPLSPAAIDFVDNTDLPRSRSTIDRRHESRTDESRSSAVTAVTTTLTSPIISQPMAPRMETPPTKDDGQHDGEDGGTSNSTKAARPSSPITSVRVMGSKNARILLPTLQIPEESEMYDSPKDTKEGAPFSRSDIPASPHTPLPTMSRMPIASDVTTKHAEPVLETDKEQGLAPQKRVEKLKGPAQTQSVNPFGGKKLQPPKSKKGKMQKGKNSIRGKPHFEDDGTSDTSSQNGSRVTSGVITCAPSPVPEDMLDRVIARPGHASIDGVMHSGQHQPTVTATTSAFAVPEENMEGGKEPDSTNHSPQVSLSKPWLRGLSPAWLDFGSSTPIASGKEFSAAVTSQVGSNESLQPSSVEQSSIADSSKAVSSIGKLHDHCSEQPSTTVEITSPKFAASTRENTLASDCTSVAAETASQKATASGRKNEPASNHTPTPAETASSDSGIEVQPLFQIDGATDTTAGVTDSGDSGGGVSGQGDMDISPADCVTASAMVTGDLVDKPDKKSRKKKSGRKKKADTEATGGEPNVQDSPQPGSKILDRERGDEAASEPSTDRNTLVGEDADDGDSGDSTLGTSTTPESLESQGPPLEDTSQGFMFHFGEDHSNRNSFQSTSTTNTVEDFSPQSIIANAIEEAEAASQASSHTLVNSPHDTSDATPSPTHTQSFDHSLPSILTNRIIRQSSPRTLEAPPNRHVLRHQYQLRKRSSINSTHSSDSASSSTSTSSKGEKEGRTTLASLRRKKTEKRDFDEVMDAVRRNGAPGLVYIYFGERAQQGDGEGEGIGMATPPEDKRAMIEDVTDEKGG